MKYILLMAAILLTRTAFSQENISVNPGIDRWSIKTSATLTKPKKVALSTLLHLPLLDKQFSTKKWDAQLIPNTVGPNLKEGMIVTTEGYLHLVALEKSAKDGTDGDYHIQITLSPQWGDSCFIVEIPYSEFISAALKDSSINNRKFIRDRLLKGAEPSTGGNTMQGTVYVRVTGQLFYDAIHAPAMSGAHPQYRGKSGTQTIKMHSYTAWEIHPVTHIEFAKKP